MLRTSLADFPPVIMKLPSSGDTATVSVKGQVTPISLSLYPWKYRGEGNANLVLAVPGEKIIVRLRKSKKNETTNDTAALISLEAEFCRAVMERLLGASYVSVPNVVRIPEKELKLLNEHLRPLRPAYRHHKSNFGNLAAVLPDFCFLPVASNSEEPTYCVEIKPKQGWVPHPVRRLPKCTFCMNQYWKQKNRTVSERSRYCPLDLFSGDQQRMKTAVKALLNSPQNNFKIFCDGTLEYGEDNFSYVNILEKWFGGEQKELVDQLCSLVIQALLARDMKEFPNWDGDEEVEDLQTRVHTNYCRIPQDLLENARRLLHDEPTCYRSPATLPTGCILSRILSVQKLDKLGCDEIYRRYSKQNCGDYDYLSELLQQRNILHPLHSYLLATTAKDCSILIAFQRTYSNDVINSPNIAEDLNGRRYLFNIGVSDLDPKPISCIQRHRKRDIEVVRSCIELITSANADKEGSGSENI